MCACVCSCISKPHSSPMREPYHHTIEPTQTGRDPLSTVYTLRISRIRILFKVCRLRGSFSLQTLADIMPLRKHTSMRQNIQKVTRMIRCWHSSLARPWGWRRECSNSLPSTLSNKQKKDGEGERERETNNARDRNKKSDSEEFKLLLLKISILHGLTVM